MAAWEAPVAYGMAGVAVQVCCWALVVLLVLMSGQLAEDWQRWNKYLQYPSTPPVVHGKVSMAVQICCRALVMLLALMSGELPEDCQRLNKYL